MAAVTSSVGLISGLNIGDIVNAVLLAQQNAVTQLQSRETGFQTVQKGLSTLSANLLSLSTSASQLGQASNFSKFAATSSDTSQLTVTAGNGAVAGSYQLQTLRVATAAQFASRGFVNADQQTLSAGTLTLSSGGRLATETALDTLNGGSGVRRGVIRITDRSGDSADVDISATQSVSDVVDAINSAQGIRVTASTLGDKIILTDETGQTGSNLTVADRNGGHAAQDLGIAQSTATSTLTGSAVYQVTGDFTLTHIGGGNQPRFIDNFADIRIGLTDSGNTQIDVDLNGAATLNDVISKINSATGNNGKVTASLSNGRLVLTDNTGGGGANPLTVTDVNGSSVVHALGLDATASGDTLTGNRLAAGIGSVLLRDLRGGTGIEQPGSITLTDRAGTTATIDLSQAESLDEVLAAINSAEDGLGTKLTLTASLNAAGNGLQITDTSGLTGNLVIEDVGAGTVAADLGITVNAAQSTVDSGSLSLRYVHQNSSLATYGAGGTAVGAGSFSIADSQGNVSIITLPSTAKTLGDVLDRINAATGGNVTAALNDTGDGFVLVDHAGGSSHLLVKDLSGSVAANLRIAGTGTTNGDGDSSITSRQAVVINVTATDTLTTLASKLNAAGGNFTASIIDDGTSFSPKRLVLTANDTGNASQIVVNDAGVGLGLDQRAKGDNALLRVGGSSGYVLSSSTNHFESVVTGLDVDVVSAGSSPAQVQVTQDTSSLKTLVQNLVNNYNTFVTQTAQQTRFDATAGTRGILQGDAVTLRVTSTLATQFTNNNFGISSSGAFRSLAELGVSFNQDGTLSLDSFKFSSVLAKSPDKVKDFFLTKNTGFAAKLSNTIKSFTDPVTGQITQQSNSLQNSVDAIEKQIVNLNAVLDGRKQSLLNQFYNMETTLSRLQSQQQAILQLASLTSSSSSSSSKSSSSS